jgi:cephalosporin hydroxylase
MFTSIEEEYRIKSETPSDINEHLPVLYEYARECETIAEFGVRCVVSTFAFAKARPKRLICVDIGGNSYVTSFLELCKKENLNAEFHQESTLNYELPCDVDLLFIDTYHTYSQLAAELKRHHSKVKKYLAFHDTVTYGYKDESYSSEIKQGLIPAIEEFLQANPSWKIERVCENNNGLTVLKCC